MYTAQNVTGKPIDKEWSQFHIYYPTGIVQAYKRLGKGVSEVNKRIGKGFFLPVVKGQRSFKRLF